MAEETKTPEVVTEPQAPPKKLVWIACRATRDCPGNTAELVSKKPNNLAVPSARGSYETARGGYNTRYRCQTCNGVFYINT